MIPIIRRVWGHNSAGSTRKWFVRQITVVMWHLRTSRVTHLHSCRSVLKPCSSEDVDACGSFGESTPRRCAAVVGRPRPERRCRSLLGLGPATYMKYRSTGTPRAWYMTPVTAAFKQSRNMFYNSLNMALYIFRWKFYEALICKIPWIVRIK